MIIDTHAHLNFNAYNKDLDEVIERTLAEDIWIINVGSKYETSKKAVEIAEKYKEGVFAAVGLHPIHTIGEFVKVRTDVSEGNFEIQEQYFVAKKYRELLNSEKVKAIGEIGLDYYYCPKTKGKLEIFKNRQKQIFIEQLNLARELDLPVIFHCRMAHNDLIEILQEYQKALPHIRGVIHCYTGDWNQSKKYLEMGFYLGFNGIIFKLDLPPHQTRTTPPRRGKWRSQSSLWCGGLDEIIKKTPLEKILVETDCPYLTPLGVEELRNEPIFIKHIIKRIAEIKKLDYQEIAETTFQNAKELFKI